MTIRVLVNGASGKMGQLAVNAIQSQPAFNLVGQTGRGHELGLAIRNTKADVVVDLTNAEVVLKNTEIIIDTGARPVIGTSGLKKDQVHALQERCKDLKLGGIIAPNFSIGAILMMKYAQEMAKYFSHVEIIEMHHDKKIDSPSGTAIKTADMLRKTLNSENIKPPINKEIIPGARGALCEDIRIHSIRLPGLVAHQQVIFGGVGETLTISHDSIDRECFMPGILLACEKVLSLNHLVYGLEHVL